MAKEAANLVAVFFAFTRGTYIVMHSGVQEREAMRRKLVVLFVAFASVFGVVACGGEVEVKEGAKEEAKEAKEEVQEAREVEKVAEEEQKEAEEEQKEAQEVKRMEEEQQEKKQK